MSVTKRIFGVLSCLLVYVGAVTLDLYNAARYKEGPILMESIFIQIGIRFMIYRKFIV